MFSRFSPRQIAIGQALFVTFLWSTSWVLIKIGLSDIPPLVFAGLRYTLAFACLLAFGLRSRRLDVLRELPRRQWGSLLLLGLLLYSLTQGAQFVGLAYLPAVTVSLLLNLTSIVVALMGIYFLTEYPTRLQWGGTALYTAGIYIYFAPIAFPADEIFGMTVVIIGVIANAASAVLGRHINSNTDLPALVVTVVSMGFGSITLLAAGLMVEGLPSLSALNWLFVVWLAVVNTAFAFTLWNVTLRTLTAMESSIINSTMLVQIALLAWLFLGERLTWKEIAGMILVAAGVLLVQLVRMPRFAAWRSRYRSAVVEGALDQENAESP